MRHTQRWLQNFFSRSDAYLLFTAAAGATSPTALSCRRAPRPAAARTSPPRHTQRCGADSRSAPAFAALAAATSAARAPPKRRKPRHTAFCQLRRARFLVGAHRAQSAMRHTRRHARGNVGARRGARADSAQTRRLCPLQAEMPKVGSIPRSATVAWSSSNEHSGLLAAGTVAGAISDTFDSTSHLDVRDACSAGLSAATPLDARTHTSSPPPSGRSSRSTCRAAPSFRWSARSRATTASAG